MLTINLKFISPNDRTANHFGIMGGIDDAITEEIYTKEYLEGLFNKDEEESTIPVVTSSDKITVDEEKDEIIISEDIVEGKVSTIDYDKTVVSINITSEAYCWNDVEINPQNYVVNFIIDEDVPEIVAAEVLAIKEGYRSVSSTPIGYTKPEILIKYHKDKYPGLMDVWRSDTGDLVDLRCAKNMLLDKGEFALIPLGISAKLPAGYHAEVVPRSSTFKKYGIIMANSVGIIDNSYCGDEDEWYMPVFPTRDVLIEQNKRICQFKIVRNISVKLTEVDFLEDEARGGFGSSGEGTEDNEESSSEE